MFLNYYLYIKVNLVKKVSVIIPSRNRKKLLQRAVNSIEKQTYDNTEVVIIDDCSDSLIDKSDFDVKNIQVHIVRNDKPLGGAISRNIGLSKASGDYICFLDDDDIYYEEKIAVLAEYLELNSSVDGVFGQIVRDVPLKKRSIPEGLIKSLSYIKYLHTNTSLIRKEVFESVIFFEELEKYQDTQFHIEIIKKKNIHYIETPVARWFQNHGADQITRLKSNSDYRRALLNFSKLIKYLNSKNLLSKKELFIFKLRLMYMKVKVYIKAKNCV